MPVFRVTSPNGRELEIEGDSMPSESELDEIFSGLPADNRPKIETPRIIGEIQQFQSPFPQVQQFSPLGERAGAPDTAFTETIFHEAPAAAGRVLHNIGEGIYETGVSAMQRGVEKVRGLPKEVPGYDDISTQEAIETYPKPVQVGIKVGEGITKSLPQLGIAMANPAAGAVAFGLTPEGFDPKAAVIAGALPFIGSKAGLLTESMALKTGLSNQQVLQGLNRIGGVTGAAALIGADEAVRISQLPPEQREKAWLDAAANVGSQFLLGGIGPMERPTLSKLGSAIENAPIQPRATVDESAAIRSGLPTRAKPEILPELQRTRELVDQAIQEATQKIVEPGKVPALELLRRQTDQLTTAETRPEFRPGGGEATGGKVSFNRPTEEMAGGTKEVSNAIQQEGERVLSPVREEPIQGQAEVPTEISSRPVDEGGGEKGQVALPETEKAYNLPTKPEVATLGSAERKNSYDDPSGTTYHASAEDWSVWQSVKDKPLTEPGVWATREAIKNKYGGMPPEPPKAVAPETTATATQKLDVKAEPADITGVTKKQYTSGYGSGPGFIKEIYDNVNFGRLSSYAKDLLGDISPNTLKRITKDESGKVINDIDLVLYDIQSNPEGKVAKAIFRIQPELENVIGRMNTEWESGFKNEFVRRAKEDYGINPEESFAAFGDYRNEGRQFFYEIDPKLGYVADQIAKYTEMWKPTEDSSLVSKLESLKLKTGDTGKLYSLPHPDAIKQIGKQLWNDSIDLAIAAIKSGKAIKLAISDAVAHIKRNARNYDENQIRANLEQILKDEGLVSPPKTRKATPKATGEPANGIEVPEGQKARSFSERATVSEKVPEPVQEQIRTDPRSAYEPQKVAEVESEVSKKSDTQLWDTRVDSPDYTLAKAELMNRLFDRGDNESGLNVLQEASEALTKAGQIINQAKILNALKPEYQIIVLDKALKKAGKDPLNEAQRGKVLELGRQGREAAKGLEEATRKWEENPTPENAKAADDALNSKNKIDLELQRFTNAFQPKSWAALLKSILQGNLLTPMSQSANLFGNLSFLPFRAGARTVATGMDIVESALFRKPRTVSTAPISGTAEAAKGLARGAKNIPGILTRGTGATILGESRAGLNPIKAWINQFSSNPEMATTEGKKTWNDRAKLLVEGTFGVPAEVMLRMLGAGDAPFKEAARARVVAEQLRLKNVPKDQWAMAQRFPELFFDKETLKQIKQDSLAAVFQRESKSLGALNSLIRNNWFTDRGVSPDVMDLAFATVAPYRLTPWNIIGEIVSFNPVVALFRSIGEGVKGNRREANLNAGKFVVGSLLTAAGYELYRNGLLTPSLDSKDEQQKERILTGQVMPPNHINISGLKRLMKKAVPGNKYTPEETDPSFRPGDETKDIFRAGGLAGAIFYMTANIGRDLEKNPQGDMSDLALAIGTQSTLEQARFGMNQSFLQGVEGLLTAVKDGNADNWVSKWASTVLSIPLPNSLTALSRATREFKPEFNSVSLKTKLENVVRNRLGFAGLDDYLPLKRGLWGEPLRETPKGKSELLYHFFDVTKGQQITDDPKAIELFKLWRKTDNSKVIPTPVDKEQTFGKDSYVLTPQQQSDLAEKVGGFRKDIVESLVTNPEWHKLPDEDKIKVLNRVYDKGLEAGKAIFFPENQGKLQKKPQKAGFNQP